MFVQPSCEERVHDPKEIGEQFFIFAVTGQMGVIRHEAVGIDFDLIAIFKPEKQVVIELFHSVGLKQPALVVALPSDMKKRLVIDDHVSGMGRHADLNIKGRATERQKQITPNS